MFFLQRALREVARTTEGIIGTAQQDFMTLLIYSVLGIALGLGVNKMNGMLSKRLPKVYSSKWAAVPLKLLPVGLALVLVQLVMTEFAYNWQQTTPGLFFVLFYFGMQTSLMKDMGRFE